MKLAVPILWPSRHTPALAAGLHLTVSPQDELGAWLHGALVVPEAEGEPAEAALLSVHLIAVSEKNQQPLHGKLIRQPAFFVAPAWEPVELEGKPHRRAAFSVHSSTLFELFVERFLVHAAAGRLLSPVVVLDAPGKAAPQLPGTLPGDGLLEAYDLALRGKHGEATEAFQRAFAAEKRVESELDAAHRYNAACAAAKGAQALRKQDPKGADALQARALRWLEADLQRRAEVHTRGSFAFAASQEEEEHQAVRDQLYRGHVRHLRGDPDLAKLPLAELLQKGPQP